MCIRRSLQLADEAGKLGRDTAAIKAPESVKGLGLNACCKLPCPEKSRAPQIAPSRETLGAAAEHGTRDRALVELQLEGMQ